jgi:hypothetical protein
MTHDELLTKITEGDDNINFYALRAVVKLHKPVTDMNGYSACEECSRIAYYNVPYPCLTNQAIQRELA